MSKNYNISASLLDLLKHRRRMKTLLLYRGDEELEFIKNRLKKNTGAGEQPENP